MSTATKKKKEKNNQRKTAQDAVIENKKDSKKSAIIDMLTGDLKQNETKENEIKENASNNKPKDDKRRKDLISLLAGEADSPQDKSDTNSTKPEQPEQPEQPKQPEPQKPEDQQKLFKEEQFKKAVLGQDSVKNSLIDLTTQLIKDDDFENYILALKSRRGNIKMPEIKASNPRKKITREDSFVIHWNGRFGNRMHTYAYAHNRAKKFGGKVLLPSDWEGKHLFNLDYEIIDDEPLRLTINQSVQPFDKLSHRLAKLREFNDRTDYNFQYCNPDDPKETYKKFNSGVAIDSVCAYHHKIFDEMNLSDVLKLYEFNDEVKKLDIYKRMEDRQGTYDIAHLRRDDISSVNYQNNGGYSVINKDAYVKAFKKYDYDPDKIEWTTDDWTGKWGVGNSIESGLIKKRGSWHYPVGSEVLPDIIFDWFPDFLRLYFARTIFRANSSFSFWACTLAKGRENPPKIFAPRLNKRVLYAKKETFKKETYFNFEEGNHPHWLCITGKDNCDNILFADEDLPAKYKK